MMSTESLFADVLQGSFIMALTLCAFVSLVWLREQIVHGNPLQVHPQNQNDDNNNENNAGNENPDPHLQNEQPAQAEVAEVQQVPEDVVPPPHPVDPNRNPAEQNEEPRPAAAPENHQANGDDNNWQPFEWAPAGGEDLTWERLLGLDGSLLFLEHVFWVISLNALFLIVFAFCPYHVGLASVNLMGVKQAIDATYFERLITTLLGYLMIGTALYCMQAFSNLIKLRKVQRVFSMCYLAVKVFLLVLMEIGVFPLICGFWLDVCSLMLFSASYRDRLQSFKTAPGTSAFLHWLVGMIYVFYFASFVLLLREVLRPGVLWFLRNLNDPEFNPIQEMIQFPVHRHLRRFVASLVMFGLTIVIIVYYPIKLVMTACPTVLPYNIHLVSLNNSSSYLNIESSLSELSLELLLLQVVLPALLEQSHARQALKILIKGWCLFSARLLSLTEYLLPAEVAQRTNVDAAAPPNNVRHVAEPLDQDGNRVPMEEIDALPLRDEAEAVHDNAVGVAAAAAPPQAVVAHQAGNLGAEHQALLLGGGRASTSFQPYHKPVYFSLRIVLLLLLLALTGLVASIICLTVPVLIGRQAIYLLTGHQKVHELYTMSSGLYICWLVVRLSFLLIEYVPWGVEAILAACSFWFITLIKCLMVAVPIFGLIPLLFGILFQLVLVVPLRVNINQTPLFFHWQDWAMGILHCKILCALIMMGPDWRIKRVFDQVYRDGFRNLSICYIYSELIIPTVSFIGSIIAIPYMTAHGLAPLFGIGKEEEMFLQRHIYPSLLTICVTVMFIYWQFKQLCNLLQRIRNERYLVGQRLVNYERAQQAENVAANIHNVAPINVE